MAKRRVNVQMRNLRRAATQIEFPGLEGLPKEQRRAERKRRLKGSKKSPEELRLEHARRRQAEFKGKTAAQSRTREMKRRDRRGDW